MGNETFDRKLAELRQEYSRMLPPKVEEIKSLWAALDPAAPNSDTAGKLFRVTHSLAGSGTVFGFPEVTKTAVRLEKIFSEMSKGNPCPDAELSVVAELLVQLEAAQGNGSAAAKTPGMDKINQLVSRPITPPAARRQVFLLNHDMRHAESLKIQMEAYQYQVVSHSDAEAMVAAAAKKRPAFILVDFAFINQLGDALKAKQAQFENTPVFFIGDSEESFELLLRVVRAGGAGYFSKPVNLGVLMDKLEHLVIDPETEPFRVLICDDDEAFAKHAAFILEKAGMSAVAINQPDRVMMEIERFQPDLLLIDLYMPDCNGFELGRVIRMKEENVGLPIIYLSVENQIQRHLEALQMGGDDFMLKPIRFNHLYKAVSARIKRARQIRSYISLDGLTGLLNHSSFIRKLKDELARAEQQGLPLCLAILDMDQFAKLNNTHGHAMGDQVLRTLARFAADRARSQDTVARFGDDRLAVILPQTDMETAKSLLGKAQAEFSGVVHRSEIGTFMASYGCGAAFFPEVKSASEMMKAAKSALISAKSQGTRRLAFHKMGEPDTEPEAVKKEEAKPIVKRPNLQRIMVVDDEADISMLVESFLESRGFEVFSCNNGDMAIGLMEKVKPHLVLIDMMLFPAASGFELVKAIRKKPAFKKVKVVGMTGAYEKSSTQEQVLSIGADAFIGKPLDLAFLANLVAGLLES